MLGVSLPVGATSHPPFRQTQGIHLRRTCGERILAPEPRHAHAVVGDNLRPHWKVRLVRVTDVARATAVAIAVPGVAPEQIAI
jgi:hypothetical protein